MLLPSKFPVGTSVDDSGSGAQAWEFASAFRHAATGMALLAPDGRALRVNPALCELVGRAEAELLSGVVPTHPEDAAADRGERERCLRGEQAGYRRELRLVHRTGAVLWVEKTCTLVRDAAGAPLHFICQVQDIGERKRAEQALRESEARFRSLTLLSSHWYWEQDEEYRFTSFDGNSRDGAWRPDIRTLGLRRWEVPGLRPLWGTWADHRALLEARRPFRDAEFVRVRPGSPPVYVSTSGEPVFDQSGRFTGYRGTTRDITAAKAAETRLRDTEALMRMAARMGRLGAWTYEVGDARVTWSDELCRLHEVEPGYAPTAAEAAGFFTAADRPRFLQAMEDCIRSGVPFDFEAKVTTSKGHERWVRVIGEAERDEQGRVRRVHGAGQDVSASRRAAERARQQAEQLANTLETLTDGFFTVDRDWRFTYLNGEVERLLGRRRDAVLGRRLDDEFPPETAPAFHGHFCQAMAQNTVVQAEAYYAPLALWIHLKIYPSPQGLAVYVRDVTERVRTQQQLLRMNAELESRVSERTARLELANRELEAFSYAIAHDLRAPLSAIEGFGQCLERFAGEGLPERGRHYLQRILAGVRHMRDLTEGLLSLASLSQASLRVRPVDLAVLAQAAAASCRARDPARAVQVAIAPNMPVEGDSRLLALVLENLVGNAWKFTARAAEARIEVGCAGAGEDGRLVYFVRDNGAGFDSAYSAKLFEPFQRLHTQEEFEGTGIGLAIVHKVVSLHGGRIWAESAPGAGATFFFTLG